jgi:hypothetical protein
VRFFALLALAVAFRAYGQTPVQDVQRAAPDLVGFAGSPVNFQSLVNGLTQGTPVKLLTPAGYGVSQMVSFTPPDKLSTGQAIEVLELARQDLSFLGISRPNAGQLALALNGGPIDTASGRTYLPGAMPPDSAQAPIHSQLVRRKPTEEELRAAQDSSAAGGGGAGDSRELPPGVSPFPPMYPLPPRTDPTPLIR